MVKIGKNILENLTTGMYKDPVVSYREYVQNSCDQIDKAIQLGIIKKEEAEIIINIDKVNRFISVEDNATGVQKEFFAEQLGDIANSDKKLGEDKGFRGIGRLCGLAYCKELIFTTSYKGENVKSIMHYNALKMREMLNESKKYTVDEVLKEIMTVEYKPEEENKHYFRVELIDINSDTKNLLDERKVRDYLSFVAPVPYSNKFIFRSKIYKHAEEIKYTIDEYRILINGEELHKEYGQYLYEQSGSQLKKYDEINDLVFRDIYDDSNNLIAWLWYGICQFKKAIPKAQNPMYGFRLRQGNIQIGGNNSVAPLFKEERGNSYYVGEIFAVDTHLIPNSQRDYFNANESRNSLEDKLRKLFYEELHKLYHNANKVKNCFKQIEELVEAKKTLAEKKETGFVDDTEKIKVENAVKEATKKCKEATRLLKKYESTESVNSIPESELKVYKLIKKNKKDFYEHIKQLGQEEKHTENQKDSKTKYYTENFSSLDKKSRKLVSRILAIINKVAPADIAAKIKSELEREFK